MQNLLWSDRTSDYLSLAKSLSKVVIVTSSEPQQHEKAFDVFGVNAALYCTFHDGLYFPPKHMDTAEGLREDAYCQM